MSAHSDWTLLSPSPPMPGPRKKSWLGSIGGGALLNPPLYLSECLFLLVLSWGYQPFGGANGLDGECI